MDLNEKLQIFLQDAIKEESIISVETRSERMLTDEEVSYINNELKDHGYGVVCGYCEACKEYSDGKEPFHIERIKLR